MSPMMRSYLATKEQYKDCIVFYRLGDFYEMFFEDAKIASKLLDITLTGRDCGLEERAPMCGVPYHAYESYAERLINKGYKVAICEQTDKVVGKIVEREVVRIITPGTVIDASMMSESSIYMMCIYSNGANTAYAYSDISTGEIFVGEYSGKDPTSYINDQIVRIMPREIICNENVMEMKDKIPCLNTTNEFKLNNYYDWAFNYNNAENTIMKIYNLDSVSGFDFSTKPCIISAGALLQYFLETQKRELKHMKLPKILRDEQFMYVDTNTRRNLEIETTMRSNSKIGSLLWVLDQTCTSGGARLLKSWVRQPLQDKQAIIDRLDKVSAMLDNRLMKDELGNILSNIQDIERLVGRIALNNITPKECISLANSLSEVPKLKSSIVSSGDRRLYPLLEKFVDVSPIVDAIYKTINPDSPALMKEGGYIRMGFNSSLDELRNIKYNSEQILLDIQTREREATGIKTLKIGYNRVYGYYIEVNKQYNDLVPFNYIRKQTISNNERYITEELKQFEEKILTSHDRALALEDKIFKEFKEQLLKYTTIMQELAGAISTIDCIYSLATVAEKNDYTRPNINNTNNIHIVSGRHPVVEKLNKQDFIPNDCILNDLDQRTIILTGPNMAGKSTYMRQVALITYMAHIGSFVPAESADICIVDRIFTRIGASDDLAVGQSTFMVEMIEVANILHYCTNNSLIILDEVGRGTSTFDGLSIAWAVVEYLATKLKAKTLFATHYHELMQLEGKYEGVKNYCISIKDIGGKLVFLRKIMRGSATRSYGIEVANLAGLPNEIISRAKELINTLENEKTPKTQDNEIINIINEIDINKLSPIAAFDTLAHLVEIVKK